MNDKKNIIFDLSRTDYKYKGVLFAEVDNEALDKMVGSPFPTPKTYIAGVMAIIWVDDKGVWNAKMRIKFPSGSKQVITIDYVEEVKKGVRVNETYILQDLYKKMPMVHKTWLANTDETSFGIVELIRKADMVESSRIEVHD